jgi:hypothetical protein
MTINEATKIFNYWKEYAEINSKLMQLMCPIPESFLPYPKETLEEALNIISKIYFDSGDFKTSEAIKDTMCFLLSYIKDEEAYDMFINSTVFKDPKLREAILNNLKKTRDSWAKYKENH